jgi:hypothetical protein
MDADVLDKISSVARKAAMYRRQYLLNMDGASLLKAREFEEELARLMHKETERIAGIESGAR